MQNNDLTSWLINNRGYIQEITKPMAAQFSSLLSQEDSAFHETICDEFNVLIKQIIATEAAKAIAVDPLTVLELLEKVDIEEYLL